MQTQSCDFVVIGSGIAGLRAAIELVKAGTVKVFCKGEPWNSNTRWAQGGIAAAMQEGDTVEFHLQDTLKAGDGLCYEPAVRVLVEEGPARIQELVNWGARFDREDGRFRFGREGAHTHNRILHAGDATGQEIVRALLNWTSQCEGLEIISHHSAVDLLLKDGACIGVEVMREEDGARIQMFCRAVVLAAGGAGQLYSHSTNPNAATGDGAAIAFRAGADMMDLEFFQFHPTAFHFSGAPRFLLTEALRGEGATLKNLEGKNFMTQYHPMADLAPRDVVSRAIVQEMRKTGASWVYLDATHLPKRKLRQRFPNIYEFLSTYDFDLAQDLIPISPSAHYWMGGVRTDLDGATSVSGLFAAGEVACTGVHGANRLASNSLLEGLVFGARAGESICRKKFESLHPSTAASKEDAARFEGDEHSIRRQLQQTNWKFLGIVRDATGIGQAMEFHAAFGNFRPSTLQELELRNLLDCSKLIGSFALLREESRGSHYREDFPFSNPQWINHHSVLSKGKLEIITFNEA